MVLYWVRKGRYGAIPSSDSETGEVGDDAGDGADASGVRTPSGPIDGGAGEELGPPPEQGSPAGPPAAGRTVADVGAGPIPSPPPWWAGGHPTGPPVDPGPPPYGPMHSPYGPPQPLSTGQPPYDAPPLPPYGGQPPYGAPPLPPYGAPPPPPYGGQPPYGAPPLPPYATGPYPYAPGHGPHPAPGGLRQLGPIFAVAVVVAVVVAAAAGAGVEYALNHGTASGQSGFFPTVPSGNSGSGTTPSGASVSRIATEVDPATVDIDTTLAQGGGAAGTGIVLTSSGLVLTNNHVIENSSTIEAQVDGRGREYGATVLGYSISDDIALLQLKNASGLRTVVTGNSSRLAVGASIVGIGNAGGTGGTPSAVGGSITAVNQTITASGDGLLPETLHGLIQIDANIEPGDSGGPLVDTAGHVVGMDTAASVSGNGFGEQSGTGGEGFAISIDNALSIVDQIKAGKASATVEIGPRALLGVDITDGRSLPGAYVDQVEPGGPADVAGITQGDTIVAIGSTTVSSGAALSEALVDHKPGDRVTIGWVDAAGARHSAAVHLVVGPPA